MKTLKEEVMELLMKRIGVVEDEEFKASNIDRGCDTYKISKDKLFFKDFTGEWVKTEMWIEMIRSFEDYEFKVKPFKPKNGNEYWYVRMCGELRGTLFDDSLMIDVLNRCIGNCFRTKELAEAHKREILEMLGIKLTQNNSLGEKHDNQTILL